MKKIIISAILLSLFSCTTTNTATNTTKSDSKETTNKQEETNENNKPDVVTNPSSTPEVKIPKAVSVSLSAETLNIKIGEKLTITGTVKFDDNTINNKIKWVSDSPEIVKIDNNGHLETISSGKAKITAFSTDNPEIKSVINVNVSSNTTTLKGTVFNTDNETLWGTTIKAKSLDPDFVWESPSITTDNNGNYQINDVPIDIRIEITAKKDSYTTKVRTEVLSLNLDAEEDEEFNIFNFGGKKFPQDKQYALQDYPEIISISIDGNKITKQGQAKLTRTQHPAEGDATAVSGINPILDIEMKFSEPINKESFENNIVIYSENRFDNGAGAFVIRKNRMLFEWNHEKDSVRVKTSLPVLQERGGIEARYKIGFEESFKDIKGFSARRYDGESHGLIKFTNTLKEDYVVFSVKNDNKSPGIVNVTANNSETSADTITLEFNKGLEVIGNKADSLIGSQGTPAKLLLTKLGADYNVIETDLDSDGNTDKTLYMIAVTDNNDNFVQMPESSNISAIINGYQLIIYLDKTSFSQNQNIIISLGRSLSGNYATGKSFNPPPPVKPFMEMKDAAGNAFNNDNNHNIGEVSVSNSQGVATAQ